MKTKDQTAQQLADAHFALDDGVVRIFRITEPDETDNSGPVRLLEVNRRTPAVGILPISMGSDRNQGVHYPAVIVEIAPTEFDLLVRGELTLPDKWSVGRELFPSERTSGVPS